MNVPIGAKPIFEFIKQPEFGDMEKYAPASKITYSIYSEYITADEIQSEFKCFLKACGYILKEDGEE